MARCPFATWRPISGSSGPHLGGPFKIVHHTTEGSTAQGAMDAFRRNRSDPHFTVDATTIFQHVDTAEATRRCVDDVLGCFRAGDVAGDDGQPIRPIDLGCYTHEFFLGAAIEHDVGSFSYERLNDRQSDAAAGPRDDGGEIG